MNTRPPARAPETRVRPLLPRPAALLLVLGCCAGLTGCFGFLKPAESTAQSFVLTAIPDSGPAPNPSGTLAVGLGRVKLPSYLSGNSLAVRRGANEIQQLPSALWAERLEAGFDRVLAADLAMVLRSDSVRIPAWNRDAVAVELYIVVEQFDLDEVGHGVLVARWRILSPGGDKLLKAGTSRLSRPGPAPRTDPSGAVATLSDLVADLSRQLAPVLQAAALR